MKTQMIGSLQNRMMEMGVKGQPDPVVGMGVTEIMWSDLRPYEIVRIDGKRVFIKPCAIIHDKSDYGHGGLVHEKAPEVELRQNKWGQWCKMIPTLRKNGKFTPGISSKQVFRLESLPNRGQYYYDPGF